MIIIVHSLYFVIRYAIRYYRRHRAHLAIRWITEQRRSEELAAVAEKPAALPLDPEECFVFPIPVYRQRYSTVQDVLLDPRWRKDMHKVVDFGCAEFGFFQYLKHLMEVTDVLEVDIDEALLRENMFRVQPLTADYLRQRSNPLTVEILRGSVCDPDWRIKGIDAVVGIEIIEHLYPDILDALPYNIFGYAQPKIAIFTTPNADFNVLFPNFKGFRHEDHKFEWSRQQFEDWSNNIVTRFPNYSVTFAGIGKGPKGTESLGCCSQMAVFVKEFDIMQSEVPEITGNATQSDSGDKTSFGVCTHYSFSQAQMALLSNDLLEIKQNGGDADREMKSDEYYTSIKVIKYPFVEDVRTPQEKLLHEATQQIFRNATPSSRFFNEETGVVEIPLYEVAKNFDGPIAREEEIKTILEAADFKVEECTPYGSNERCLCVRYDFDIMTGRSSHSASEYEVSDNADEAEHDDDDDFDPWRAPLDAHAQEEVTLPLRNVNSSIESTSDWEAPTSDERGIRTSHASKDEAATPSDPLVDSGYQKSLSNAEWSPQSPIDGHFDEQFIPKMDVNDIKDSIKARMAQNRTFMNNRLLSEWIRISGGASGSGVRYNHTPGTTTTAPPSLGGAVKLRSPTAGTSSSPRRRKAASCYSPAKGARSDSEESNSAKEDIRAIADVLLYNSLNKLDLHDLPQVEQVVLPVERPQDLELPQFIVENGDLANNNRDGEGNNYPEVVVEDVVRREPPVDDVNENVDVRNLEQGQGYDQGHAAEDEENRNVGGYFDDGIVADAPPLLQAPIAAHPAQQPLVANVAPPIIPLLEIIDIQYAQPAPPPDEDDEEELNHASREALFDPNSLSDMLEDGSITDETDADATFADVDTDAQQPESVTPVNNLFPNWLLQLLGGANANQPEDADANGDDVPDEDEPHYYCQGDGIGIHPSIVEVDIETSSNSSSTDEAQAERTISENDLGSLPTDGVTTITAASTSDGAAAALALFGRALDIPIVLLEQTASNMSQDSGGEEFYDTVQSPNATSPQDDDDADPSNATSNPNHPEDQSKHDKF